MKKKSIIYVAIGIALLIAIVLAMPLLVFSPAELLYQFGQYEQAYRKAAQISDSGIGSMLSEGRIEKYAYAYLSDYTKKRGTLEARLPNNTTVKVSSYGSHEVFFGTLTDTNEYMFFGGCEIYQSNSRVEFHFNEDKYEPTLRKTIYSSSGELNREEYSGSKSIKLLTINGSPSRSNDSSLFEYAEITISNALSLIQNELGIPAKHLGFYAYWQ